MRPLVYKRKRGEFITPISMTIFGYGSLPGRDGKAEPDLSAAPLQRTAKQTEFRSRPPDRCRNADGSIDESPSIDFTDPNDFLIYLQSRF